MLAVSSCGAQLQTRVLWTDRACSLAIQDPYFDTRSSRRCCVAGKAAPAGARSCPLAPNSDLYRRPPDLSIDVGKRAIVQGLECAIPIEAAAVVAATGCLSTWFRAGIIKHGINMARQDSASARVPINAATINELMGDESVP